MEFLSIIYEKADMNCLDYINNFNYPLDTIFKLSSELFCALSYIHSKRLYHCDIKPTNMLITMKNNIPSLSLCDFGFTRYFTHYSKRYHNISTLWYRDPCIAWEVSDYKYTLDIWSAGCSIYEMVTKNALFKYCPKDPNPSEYMELCLNLVPNTWSIESQKHYRSYSKLKVEILKV